MTCHKIGCQCKPKLNLTDAVHTVNDFSDIIDNCDSILTSNSISENNGNNSCDKSFISSAIQNSKQIIDNAVGRMIQAEEQDMYCLYDYSHVSTSMRPHGDTGNTFVSSSSNLTNDIFKLFA